MNKARVIWTGVALMLAAGAAPLLAQQDLPSPEKVMAKYVEVTGGVDKYKAVKSVSAKGALSIPAMGIEGTMEMMQVLPDKVSARSEIPGVGEQRQGGNGEVFWEISPVTGNRLLEGKEAQQLLDTGNMARIYDPGSYYKSMKTLGIEEVDGEKCYQLELIKESGDKVVEYYSIDSGLQVKSEGTIEVGGMGKVNIVTMISGYKDCDGIKTPLKLSQQLPNGITQVVEFSEWNYNADIPADAFKLPAEIEELVK